MEPKESFDNIRTKNVAVLPRPIMQSIRQKRKQRAAQPFMRRNIEAGFGALQDGLRQLVFHQFLQDHFLLSATNL